MSLTKKSKIIALVTVAIMCLAIIITAGIVFAPNRGDNDGINVVKTADPHTNYENGGYGMDSTVTYDSSNTNLAKINGVENAGVSILYPNKIYMDVTENLKDLGYYFFLDMYYLGGSANNVRVAFMLNAIGHYSDATNLNTSSSYYNMMNAFEGYNIDDYHGVENGSVVVDEPKSYGDLKNNRMLVVKPNDKSKHFTTYLQATGTPKGKRSFTYNSTNAYLLTYQQWSTIGWSWSDTRNSFISSFANESGSATFNGVTTSYTNGMSIRIEIYDKSALFNALKTLDNKYQALNNAGLLSQAEATNYINYRNGIVSNYLNKREVTQAELDTKLNEVNAYVFRASVSANNFGSMYSPIEANYSGFAYGLDTIWNMYNSNIPGTSTSMKSCFLASGMMYSSTGFDGSSIPVDNDKMNQMTNAGFYTVSFKPTENVTTIRVSNMDIKVTFAWKEDNTSDQKTAYFLIKKAQISALPTSAELQYKGNTPNTVTGLPEGSLIRVVNESVNTPNIQLSLVDKGNNYQDWNGVGDTVSFADVTPDAVTVYARISASNHEDAYVSFSVKINPADISIKLKKFQQYYHDKLLTSDEIFANMLDENTPLILDAEGFEDVKNYLEQALTFQILGHEGSVFDPAVDYPNAGNYTVNAVKATAWTDKINKITFITLDGESAASNINSYIIKQRPLNITWTDNVNRWYDNARGHRPSAEITAGQDLFGQVVGLSDVGVVLDSGTNLDGTGKVELVGGNAVNVGKYTARVAVLNPNFTIAENQDLHDFYIYRRKITIDIQDRTRQYAESTTADNVEAQYKDVILTNNNNNEAYIATLDGEIASATDNSNAIVHSVYKEVFGVEIVAERTKDGKYFKAGEHTLKLSLVNNNYELDESSSDGKFTVTKRDLSVSMKQLPPKVYNGDYQQIVFPKNSQTVTAYGYEFENMASEIKVEYSSTGQEPWATNPIEIKNVATVTVHCRVSAENHNSFTFTLQQELRAVYIEIFVGGQEETVYYGSEIPTSQQLIEFLHMDFTIEGRKVDSVADRAIDPSIVFEFYLVDPTSSSPVYSRNADAGKYTVSHKLAKNVTESIENFNMIYHSSDASASSDPNRTGDNVNAYTISPKPLYVNWEQSGDRWVGDGKDHYIFSNTIPTVFPKAPNSYNGEVNVVEGDEIHLESIELDGSKVNEVGYEVVTKLTTDRNQRNYVLQNDRHTFFIDKLTVKIAIKDQQAVYGKLSEVPLGALIDPVDSGAIWSYAQGSEARFYADHYRNYKFILSATPAQNGLVNVGSYPIGIVANTGQGDGSVRACYNVEIVKDEVGKTGTFKILPADIRFTGRQFNVAFDLGEDTVLTKQMLIDRIDTGIDSVKVGEFEILMSQKFLQSDTSVNENNATWVNSTSPVTDEIDCKRYYVLLKVTHPDGNFNKFTQRVELNILSKWVSVTIGSGVTDAEYGDAVHTPQQLFESLKDGIQQISGFMDGPDQMWNTNKEGAIELLNSYVEFFVGAGDLTEELTNNDSVGDYSIFMRLKGDAPTGDGAYENFRFVARKDESDTSNINAYHVNPRTVSVVWENMDEIYGDHGNSHKGYTITNVREGDEEVVRVSIEYGIASDTASFDEGGHAFTAGIYTATVVSVSNPNYRIDLGDSNLTTQFEIRKKTIEISLNNREFIYGAENTRLDNINNALNVYSENPNYNVISKTPFVGQDKRVDVFEIYFEAANAIDSKFTYLPVNGTNNYTIKARQLDTVTSNNYEIIVVAGGEGKLTINPASAGFSENHLTTMSFNAKDQLVTSDSNWIIVRGDVDYNKANTVISYKIIDREDWKAPESDYIPEGEFTVRDAGRYTISVQVSAPNHIDYFVNVGLNVTPANVIINMNQAEKTYGDTLADLIKDDPELTTLSDWLIKYCNITITSYSGIGEGRDEVDITKDALRDFEFYVVDSSQGDGGDELVAGSYQNAVGTYRVYHKMKPGALHGNYTVEYYQAPGALAKCNADAYKIVKRSVDVVWSVEESDKKNWNDQLNKYYYTGERPKLVATFETLPNAGGVKDIITLNIEGNGADFGYGVNADGESYTAYVVHSYWESNPYASNYELSKDTYVYSIVKRPLRIEIGNQIAGVYGDNNIKGNYTIAQGVFSIYDVTNGTETRIESLPGNPILLSLDNKGVGADKFLPAGNYNISGECNNHNYDVTFTGENGSDDCGKLIVEKAEFNLSASKYDEAKFLGKEITLDFKDILPVNAGAFVAGDDWEKAWQNAKVLYKQEDGTYNEVKPTFVGATENHSISYRIIMDNYTEYNNTLSITVQKGIVNISISDGAYSIYGDGLLTSEQIFANTDISLGEGSDDIQIDVKDIVTLFVNSAAVNAGRYDIEFNYVDGAQNNFDVRLLNNGNKYQIKPRTLEIEWKSENDDDNFDYVFDGASHKVKAIINGVISGDTIEPRYFNMEPKDEAGTYTVRLLGIGSNANYAMPEIREFVWEIKPRPINIIWTVDEYVYDGTLKTPIASVDPDSVVEGFSCGISSVLGGGIDAGTYTATVELNSTNYTVSNVEYEFVIAPKSIDVVWSDTSFVYDGSAHIPTATVVKDGIAVAGDKVEVNVSGEQTNKGNYVATATSLSNKNYKIGSGATVEFTIAPKEVKIHWANTMLTYNGEAQAPVAKLEGVLNGDTVEAIVEGAQVNANDSYKATVTGLSNSNYAIAADAVKEIQFSIAKGRNEFVNLPNIGEVVDEFPWSGENKPYDKFGGQVIIKYYTDEACTQEFTGDISKAPEGSYWVVAIVEATENYEGIQSIPYAFSIEGGFNVGLVVSGIVISVLLLGAVLALVLITIKKRQKGGAV